MVNKIQNTFKIQDFEILSGIKAHTIRIWEKRYGILTPERKGGNIRVYDVQDLQKILNLSFLVNHKYKISEIAKLSEIELSEETRKLHDEDLSKNSFLNSLVMCMYTFNENLFEEIYQEQLQSMSFEDIFIHTYAPLLNYIGMLWQTNGVNPAHEHFISNLIREKITLNRAQLQRTSDTSQVHVLFLPEGEVHDLGLHFLAYRLRKEGKKIVYLGKDIPFDNLIEIKSLFKNITWICSFMIDKLDNEKEEFIHRMTELLGQSESTCWIIGQIWSNHTTSHVDKRIDFYSGYDKVLTA